MDDNKLACASWHYPFGTRLKVTNLHNHRSVICTVTDRGPARHLVRQGRILDLSRAAFERIAPLSAGVIPIAVEVVR